MLLMCMIHSPKMSYTRLQASHCPFILLLECQNLGSTYIMHCIDKICNTNACHSKQQEKDETPL